MRGEGQLKIGSLTLAQLFDKGDHDEMLAKLKVVSVLESLPGVGKVRARRIMAELDISESRRLRGLGRNQRRRAARTLRLTRRPDPACDRGVLLVLAGPSGVGKGTVGTRLLRARPEPALVGVVDDRGRAAPARSTASTTTSSTATSSSALRDAGGFLEWFEVYGDLKGTPREPSRDELAAGHDVLLEVDVQGALAVESALPEALLVFVRAAVAEPSSGGASRPGARETPSSRSSAGSTAAEAEERIGATDFDAVVVNDDVERAVGEVAAILKPVATAAALLAASTSRVSEGA